MSWVTALFSVCILRCRITRAWCWGRLKAKEEGSRGWDGFNGHEFAQTPGDSEGQGSLACYSPWSHKESDTTEWLNSDSNTRAFAICLWRGGILCCCSCWPLTLPAGNSGCRVRHSVLQGNWWNKSLDRYFQELTSWSQSLHLLISRKALNLFIMTSAPCG